MVVAVAGRAAGEIRVFKFPEISTGMAANTVDRSMFAYERVMRFCVIEASLCDAKLLPACRRMAFLAVISEGTLVVVFMAISTAAEGDTFKLEIFRISVSLLPVILYRMTLLACDLSMASFKMETGA